MSEPSILRLAQVSKQFSRCLSPAVDQLTLELRQGDILSLLGPSGCGKTTLLRMVAGFEQPNQGSIVLAGQVVAGDRQWVAPEHRDVGMVFQDYALFPHLSVADNIAFGLKNQRRQTFTSTQIKERVRDAIALVGLSGLEKRYPHELSGGQQQRVALARALAPHPSLILLDEPLSNLDVQVRLRLRQEVRQILKTAGISALFVTHDQEEALSMSDRVAVMCQGRLEQVGTPEEIYKNPATRFVAEFVSQANCLPAQRRGNLWETEIGCFPVRSHPNWQQGIMMIRQEDLLIQPDREGTLRIRDRQFLGREHRYCLISESGQEFHARSWTEEALAIGSLVKFSIPSDKLTLFPAEFSTEVEPA
ncbi:MAG: ABC transporter ATP-binding protein [Synechococcales bacterium]|nr:ABC transporter ATP-binding protein [Synechococcales bacterium]